MLRPYAMPYDALWRAIHDAIDRALLVIGDIQPAVRADGQVQRAAADAELQEPFTLAGIGIALLGQPDALNAALDPGQDVGAKDGHKGVIAVLRREVCSGIQSQ